MRTLKLVDGQADPAYQHALLLAGNTIMRLSIGQSAEVSLPLISQLLYPYVQLGPLINAGPFYGLQVSAEVTILWRGEKRRILGAFVPLMDGPAVMLPFGFLEHHVVGQMVKATD
jgi:hypothetical protein